MFLSLGSVDKSLEPLSLSLSLPPHYSLSFLPLGSILCVRGYITGAFFNSTLLWVILSNFRYRNVDFESKFLQERLENHWVLLNTATAARPATECNGQLLLATATCYGLFCKVNKNNTVNDSGITYNSTRNRLNTGCSNL